MRTPHDVQLSLQRYLALVLPGYEIRALTEQGTLERPYATIADTTPANEVVGGTLAVRDLTQGYAIVVFPEPDESEDPYKSRALAAEVEDLLYGGFQLGGIDGSRAMRIPLYDWDAATIAEVNTARTTKDFIRVTDYSTRAVQSPSDETLYSIVCDLRCAWSRAGLRPETGVTAAEVHLEINGQ